MITEEEFRTALNDGLKKFGISPQKMAQILKTPAGTVTRWMYGHSAPAEPRRQEIVDYFKNKK